MQIAIVTAWYPNRKNPLYGVFIQNQARALADHCSVCVLLLKWSLIPYEKEWKDGKVTVIERGAFYFPNASEQFLKFWASAYIRFFKRIHSKFAFDLVHCHDHYGAFVGDIIKNKMAIPYICTIHNSNIMNDELVSWKKSYLPRILKNADRVISVGKKLADKLESGYQIRHVKIIPNYINTDQFCINSTRNASDFRFLFVGGLEHHKGILELIIAFHRAELENSSLHVVGDGVQKKEIANYIKANKLEECIFLYGAVPNDQLPEIYNRSHVYVSVSAYETFGVTVLEAMACGLPILYTASGGPDEMVNDFAGLEVKERSIAGIQNGLTEIKEKYNTFNAQYIRAHVISQYGSQKIVGDLLNEYKLVLDAKT
jgi:glycosyltransferase involved in cell wall biosynthesis